MNRFKNTSRPQNPNVPMFNIINRIIYELDINVVLLEFINKTQRFSKCNHSVKSKCSLLVYKYTNFLTSLIFPNNYLQYIFCICESKVYVVYHFENLSPLLINVKPQTDDTIFKNCVIHKSDVLNIINKKESNYPYPFSIIIYSSNSFTPSKLTHKNIELIGHYSNTLCDDTVHLLLTPALSSYDFTITVLNQIPNLSKTAHTIKNNTFLPHKPEGIGSKNHLHKSSSTKKLLNENFCMCEHPETQFIPIEQPKQYLPLGKEIKKSIHNIY